MDHRLFIFSPAAVLFALVLAACGKPSPGDSCNTTELVCSDSRNALSCFAGKYLTTPCEGPGGCNDSGGKVVCDDSIAPLGTPCAPDHNLKLACSNTGRDLIQCVGGLWRPQSSCSSCVSAGGVPQCSQGNTEHDNGSNDAGTEPDAGTLPGSDGGTDPCNGVPVGGQCVSASLLEFCAVSTGSAEPHVATLTCGAGMACEGSPGSAKCVQTAACLDGETQCNGASTLQRCQGGQWVSQSCPNGCSASAVGAFCNAAGLVSWSGKVTYEAKPPNSGLTDWSTTASTVPARGFLVLSRSGKTTLSAAVTDSQGNFTVQVPASPTSTDQVYVVAASADQNGNLQYMVASPELGQGTFSAGAPIRAPQVWAWSWAANQLPSSKVLAITVADGSGAARLFDNLRAVWSYAKTRFGRSGLSVVVWLDFGTDWDCGACFSDTPVVAFSTQFSAQVWYSGGADEQYWADPVIAHELGHWVMASFGTSPQEGGIHFLGNPTFPGQAWSEGWATFFSSDARGSPHYYDKQSGSMFWVDLGARQYSSGSAFIRPTPSNGLIQLMEENEVSAMLWELRNSSSGAPAAIFNALASPHMNTSPWPRGYTRHTWQVSSSGAFTNVVDTGYSRPFVADFFDAMMCSGFSAAAMDAATDPTTAYPYPSQAPLCP